MTGSDRAVVEGATPLKGTDAFWLTDLYPDAKALFEHEQVNIAKASADCIIVLDANVLLLPFEFTSASLSEIEKVYKDLSASGRLVVPGQAVREFYKHRTQKITAIADALDASIGKAKKQIFEKSIPLLESDDDYIAARNIGKELIKKGVDLANKLQMVNKRLKDEVGSDRVSSLYRDLLPGSVSDFIVAEADRDNFLKEVARRARLQIAPGYKDQRKEDGGIGDYLIWQVILQEARSHKAHCIFVTEEEKPDWWVKRHGTFQARPELIEEYRRASGGKSLHLLPLSGLLSLFKADQQVVQQVQELEESKKFSFVFSQPKRSLFTDKLSEKDKVAYEFLKALQRSSEEELQLADKQIEENRSLVREGDEPDILDSELEKLEKKRADLHGFNVHVAARLRKLTGAPMISDELRGYLARNFLLKDEGSDPNAG